MTFAMQFFDGPALQPISPMREIGAYESIWLEPGCSFTSIAGQFAKNPSALPSNFATLENREECAAGVLEYFRLAGVDRYGVRIHRAGDYPQKLREARTPVELLYYQGTWEPVETDCIAVVGSESASWSGVNLADKMARVLAMMDYTVVSGLGTTADMTAHRGAIDAGGNVIAVTSSPLGDMTGLVGQEVYQTISRSYLVTTPVPVLRYQKRKQSDIKAFRSQMYEMMSALTAATIIVDAEDDSDVLIQAKAALYQGRKLFIPDFCFQRQDIKWPRFYEDLGAIRIREPADLWRNLE